MSNLVLHRESKELAPPLPGARVPIDVRPAMMDDIPFIDSLQKMHSKAVGWMARSWLEANIEQGNVLVAETTGTATLRVANQDAERRGTEFANRDAERRGTAVGYIIGRDKYMKREDVGILYQVNVAPEYQRMLVGASLLKALFERAAYGCRLFCGWCAQDLEANRFWEAMGFVPLAFRTGSRPRLKKDGTVSQRERIHIFWQRRIREGDTQTPYWFPSQTSGGALREDRLVLPIPPGTHWSDAKPAVLPGFDAKLLESRAESEVGSASTGSPLPGSARGRRTKKQKVAAPVPPPGSNGGLWFAPPPPESPPPPTAEEIAQEKKAAAEKRKAERKQKRKNDPKLVAAARELRDRYLEEANVAGGGLLPGACGKYDVSRQLAPGGFALPIEGAMKIEQHINLLEAA